MGYDEERHIIISRIETTSVGGEDETIIQHHNQYHNQYSYADSYMKFDGYISKKTLAKSGYNDYLDRNRPQEWLCELVDEKVKNTGISEQQQFLDSLYSDKTMKDAYDVLCNLYELKTGKKFTSNVILGK